MNPLTDFLHKHQGYIDYDILRENDEMRTYVYSLINIQHKGTPFDYFQSISLCKNGKSSAAIFIEPVGTLSFSAPSLEMLFKGLQDLFNSQPEDMDYIRAGHALAAYAGKVRKDRGIDVRYVDVQAVWTANINPPEPLPLLSFEDLCTGRDLFHFVKQQNRVPMLVLEDTFFENPKVTDLMVGEILHVEEQMPDFFKLIIDFRPYKDHNLNIFHLSGRSDSPDSLFAGITEQYLFYDQDLNQDMDYQLIQAIDLPHYQSVAEAFWKTSFDGSYLDYTKKPNPSK